MLGSMVCMPLRILSTGKDFISCCFRYIVNKNKSGTEDLK